MPESRKEYRCTVTVTDGFEERFTKGMAELYDLLEREGLLPREACGVEEDSEFYFRGPS